MFKQVTNGTKDMWTLVKSGSNDFARNQYKGSQKYLKCRQHYVSKYFDNPNKFDSFLK